jgi:hypothetical protein
MVLWNITETFRIQFFVPSSQIEMFHMLDSGLVLTMKSALEISYTNYRFKQTIFELNKSI